MKNYYAVRVGYNTGIYDNLEDAKAEIRGYSRAQWRGFNRYDDAQEYLDEMEQSDDSEEDSDEDSDDSDDGDNRDYYVVENMIFDQWLMAYSEAGGVRSRVRSYSSLRAAKRYVLSEYQRHYVYQREDLFHYDSSSGRTVYEVYTDGACSGNGRNDSKAGIGVYFGANNPNNVCKRLPGSIQTNNRAELAAIKEAYLAIINMNDRDTYEIYTDSSYAINCLTIWCKFWDDANDWTNSRGDRVANKTLIQSILWLMDRPECANIRGLRKVQAHGSCEGNNEADELARDGVNKTTTYHEDREMDESDIHDDGEGDSDGSDYYY